MQACQPKCSRRPGDTMHWLGMLRLSASVWNATAASGSWPGGGWGLLGSQGGGVREGAPLWVALGACWVPRADFSLKIPPWAAGESSLKGVRCGQMETPWEMGWGLRGLAGGETNVGTSGEQWPFARSVLGRRNKS